MLAAAGPQQARLAAGQRPASSLTYCVQRRSHRRAACLTLKASGSDDGQQGARSRREFLLQSSALAPAIFLAANPIGTDDPTTVLNAVLSGYGLPMLKASNDLKLYDEFENDWTMAYPKAWVSRPNTLRSGFYVSNFQTADKATVEIFPLPEGTSGPGDEEVVRAAVAASVVPGAGQGQADDKLTLPPQRLVKREERQVEGQTYVYLTYPSETITRSGYNIKRKHFTVVAVKRGKVYTASASARSDQYNKDKEAVLRQIVDSFRVR